MNNTTRFTAFIALVLLVSSCGIVKTQYADWTYKGRGNDERTPEFKDDAYLYELADRFGLITVVPRLGNDLIHLYSTQIFPAGPAYQQSGTPPA